MGWYQNQKERNQEYKDKGGFRADHARRMEEVAEKHRAKHGRDPLTFKETMAQGNSFHACCSIHEGGPHYERWTGASEEL